VNPRRPVLGSPRPIGRTCNDSVDTLVGDGISWSVGASRLSPSDSASSDHAARAATYLPWAVTNPMGKRTKQVFRSHCLCKTVMVDRFSIPKLRVEGIVRGLSADLIGTGVTAVAVSPGSTDTRMLQATADLYGLSSVQEFATSSLLQRIFDPGELAAVIAFCCSVDGASLNGSVVSASGGFSG